MYVFIRRKRLRKGDNGFIESLGETNFGAF